MNDEGGEVNLKRVALAKDRSATTLVELVESDGNDPIIVNGTCSESPPERNFGCFLSPGMMFSLCSPIFPVVCISLRSMMLRVALMSCYLPVVSDHVWDGQDADFSGSVTVPHRVTVSFAHLFALDILRLVAARDPCFLFTAGMFSLFPVRPGCFLGACDL